jgi:hypothetical protein
LVLFIQEQGMQNSDRNLSGAAFEENAVITGFWKLVYRWQPAAVRSSSNILDLEELESDA